VAVVDKLIVCVELLGRLYIPTVHDCGLSDVRYFNAKPIVTTTAAFETAAVK